MLKTDPAKYFFPPRPDRCVPRDDLDFYYGLGWRPQLKFNDSRALIKVLDGRVELWNRHGERMRSYTLPGFLADQVLGVVELLGFDPSGFHVFDGGLLDQKHAAIKDCLVFWDVLVVDGFYLVGTSYAERYGKLCGAYEPWLFKDFNFGFRLADNVLLADWFSGDFSWIWDFVGEVNGPFASPLIEGVVVKDPGGLLQYGFKVKNNTEWLVKSRVSTLRHRF
jgi:hypothetical protein